MKKKILTIIVLVITLFTVEVNAKQFYGDEKVRITEQQEHSVFAAGLDVNVSSFIDGAAFLAGEEINISSSQDVLFAAGEEININEAYTKDAFLLGSDIEIDNSQIRDLFVFAEDIEINSPISHNAYLAGTKVIINAPIAGNVNITASEIVITSKASIAGTLKYPENAYVRIADGATIAKERPYKINDTTDAVNMKIMVEDFILSYLSITLIGLILIWLFKKQFTALEKEKLTVNNIAKKTGLGLLALITIPVAACIAMVTIIGMPLSIVVLLLYGILIYLSIIPSGYYIAYNLLKDKVKNKYLLLAIGILGIKVFEIIPIIGGFVVFISLCFGLWTMLNIKNKTTKEK